MPDKITLCQAIDAFTYDGIDFEFVQLAESLDKVVLIASCTRPCSVNPGADFTVKRALLVPWLALPHRHYVELRHLVHYLEGHEVDEAIKVDGVALFDPHSWEDTPHP